MALEIERKPKRPEKPVVVKYKTFLDVNDRATRKVKDAVKLFQPAGAVISAAEAREVGLTDVDQVPVLSEPSPAEPEMTPEPEAQEVESLPNLKRANLAQLQKAARDRDLDDSGTKKDIIKRLEKVRENA